METVFLGESARRRFCGLALNRDCGPVRRDGAMSRGPNRGPGHDFASGVTRGLRPLQMEAHLDLTAALASSLALARIRPLASQSS